MAIKTVFFDFGGTLYKMRRDTVMRLALEKHGYIVSELDVRCAYKKLDAFWVKVYIDGPITPEELRAALKESDSRVIANLELTGDKKEAEGIVSMVEKSWEEIERTVNTGLYPDVEHCLSRLKGRGLKLGLISNAEPDVDGLITTLGLKKYLDPIVISGVIGYSKPRPEIFNYALEAASATAQESMHVGDVVEADVVGAQGVGITPVLLDRDDFEPGAQCSRVRSLYELEGLLQDGQLSRSA